MSDHRGQSSLSPVQRVRDGFRPSRGESGHSTGYSSGRERVPRPSRMRPQSAPPRPSHPLIGEIERLLQACDAHEREIRASQNTINHQLAEWSGKFDTLHDIDTQAEKMAFDVKQMLDDTKSEHTELVDKCVQDGERWVEETRSKMESWNEAWPDQKEKGDKWELWKGKIQLARGYYESEQERLDNQLAEKLKTRRRVSKVVRYTCGGVMLFVLVVLALLWTFEWR